MKNKRRKLQVEKTNEETEIFNQKLDQIDMKMKTLDEQEDLLLDQLKNINEKKRKIVDLDKNVEKKKLNKGKENLQLAQYEESFNCNLENRVEFAPTAMVRIECMGVHLEPTRGFIDSGSQPSLIDNGLARKLKFGFIRNLRRLIGINGDPFEIRYRLILKIRPWYETVEDVYLEEIFWVLPEQSGWNPIYMPNKILNPAIGQNSTDRPLADKQFWLPNKIHLIFGIGFFARIIMSVIQRNFDGTALMDTFYGIIIFGAHKENHDQNGRVFSAIQYNESEQLDKLLKRLWEGDQIENCSPYTEEELQVEKHFLETHFRDETGRFVAKLPIKENISDIGSSKEIAWRRFIIGERKRMKNPRLQSVYVEKMREMIHKKHLVLATEKAKPGELQYYIPHHSIKKDDRIVYDASCKTDKGISLNDIQLLGPKLQKDLHEIIMRFRRHKVAIYADIKKMFNQVRLAQEQWKLQTIFWRENPNQPLREYWFTVITFGLSASAFIAVRCVIEAGRQAKDKYPNAAKAIEKDFYMDDTVTGAESISEAIKLGKQMYRILKGAGFELAKWRSNKPEVIQAMSNETEVESTVMLSEVEDTTKVLGIKWLIEEDKFTFVVKSPKLEGVVTKRRIVSCVAQLYDPNGYLSPVIIIGKIMIQDLWRIGVDWDEKVPQEIEDRWNEYWNGIIHLEKFTIDRWLKTESLSKTQIHGFSDSSEAALGACLYVRSEYPNGMVTSNLLTSKTKVTPLRTVTIPRLELAAAEMLSRMLKRVMESMEWEAIDYVLWTDSSVAYHWIKKVPRELKTYVGNRVASIQNNTDIRKWRHIDGKQNPADLLTRGLIPIELVNNAMWLHGPDWLTLPEVEWPKSTIMQEPTEQIHQEMKVFSVTGFKDQLRIGIKGTTESVPLLEYVSKLEQVVNIISYAKRFIRKWLHKPKGISKRARKSVNEIEQEVFPPTKEEKAEAMEYLIRKTQQQYYNKELTALKAEKRLPEKSIIESLKPVMDDKEVLRVGGRLDRAEIDYEMKHPVIIPNGSKLAILLIDYAHRKTKHGGSQLIMQFIRQSYWIPKLRRESRNFIHKCVVCVRLNARLEKQLMAELPGERVQVGKPFLHTGVDYAGPFELKMISRTERGVRKKCWVAIFVCLKTRAVHIEIVTSLSTVDFIACYERFIARRGRCEKMFSDNGTGFVGADKEFKKALEKWAAKEMLDHLHERGTEWKFIAPAAPHQGGIYEAAVKSMKFHLKRIIMHQVLPYEQFNTLLIQIEAILNSRPLHPLSDDPNDIQALTPGHFLVGEPLILPLPFDLDNRPDTVGTRLWRERQKMIDHFWKRWQMEYLSTLQERKKWRREKENIKLGQLVLIKSENFPPTQWALGRVCKLLPGKDGLVRTVVVQLSNNQLTRPIQKLVIVPVEAEKLE